MKVKIRLFKDGKKIGECIKKDYWTAWRYATPLCFEKIVDYWTYSEVEK